MSSSGDIWFAFARTFSVLFLVLALLILVFYLIKKFSMSRGIKGSAAYINVMAMHHLSPKEKLVLVDVLGQTVLIGVTPGHISKITSLDLHEPISKSREPKENGFSKYLSQKMKPPVHGSETGMND